MKRSDYTIAIVIAVTAISLIMTPGFNSLFAHYNSAHAYIMSFIKFAVLATFGECLALRIVEGVYWKRGFGLIPKMVVWGLLGMGIKAAFVTFVSGVPNALGSLGLPIPADLTDAGFFQRLMIAFGISCFMNCIFAPVFMTLHKITDGHINDHEGGLKAIISPIDMARQFKAIDWDVMWNFVFKRTIPFFWIPAHTVTFMLPSQFRVLFAALLGVALGVILALAKHKAKPA